MNQKIEYYILHSPENLKKWNKSLNKTNPMSILEKHNNPLIKFEENQRRAIILSMVGKVNGQVIADVGCEEGYNAKKLIQDCSKIYCIDIDEDLLNIAKNKINDHKAEFIQSDAQDIKLANNSVDLAISSHVLEHLPSQQKGFDELVRITKPGGKIVINVPNEVVVLKLKNILKSLKMDFLLGKLNTGLAPGHLHIFNKNMLLNIIGNKASIKKIRYNFPFYTNLFVVLEPVGK